MLGECNPRAGRPFENMHRIDFDAKEHEFRVSIVGEQVFMQTEPGRWVIVNGWLDFSKHSTVVWATPWAGRSRCKQSNEVNKTAYARLMLLQFSGAYTRYSLQLIIQNTFSRSYVDRLGCLLRNK